MTTQPPELYAILAEKYNLPVSTIREVIIYFWRSGVKRSLEGMVDREIYINKLGSFKIKDYKLKYAIPSADVLSKKTHRNIFTNEYFIALYDQLLRIDEVIKDIKNQNKLFRAGEKQDSRDIQKSETDLGGVEE